MSRTYTKRNSIHKFLRRDLSHSKFFVEYQDGDCDVLDGLGLRPTERKPPAKKRYLAKLNLTQNNVLRLTKSIRKIFVRKDRHKQEIFLKNSVQHEDYDIFLETRHRHSGKHFIAQYSH